MASQGSWAPRVAQEAKLRRLDRQIAGLHAAVDVEIERAVLLVALDRPAEAQQAFVDLLLRAPTNFKALNEFGNCLAAMGFIAAACRVYSEAITHHPENPVGHVNLANLLLHGNDLAKAREHYETALRLDPDLPQAHQGLGAALAGIGDNQTAKLHFAKGFRQHCVEKLPYRGTRPPVSLMLLVSSGNGNIPTTSLLDDRVFRTSVVVADFFDPSIPVPEHHLVFNAIGDADLCQPALEAAARLTKRTSAPIINHPSAVSQTSRVANAVRLRAIPDVVTPRTVALPRAALAGPSALAAISRHGFQFPLLLRTPGFHTGHNFVLVESAAELRTAAANLPGDDLLVIEYLDAWGEGGYARKYRVMIVDGRIYPLHLAVSRSWKVHYFTADMADRADHRSEDAAFLRSMPSVIGERAIRALERIATELALDYGGIDFGLSPDGGVLLFEANATMVVNPPGADQRWDYRRPAVAKILEAVNAMILGRAAAAQKQRVA
jgi:glutathione synthase/RimK-type ligase-like ATP-grasp enzyme